MVRDWREAVRWVRVLGGGWGMEDRWGNTAALGGILFESGGEEGEGAAERSSVRSSGVLLPPFSLFSLLPRSTLPGSSAGASSVGSVEDSSVVRKASLALAIC